jgi:hypothetical protein
VAPSDAARAIADELARQLKNHPRFSLLLMPAADVVDGEDVVSIYWLDRDGSGAADRVVRLADYDGQRPDEAASRIISSLSLTA